MKRNECTVETLKALGYTAKVKTTRDETEVSDCNQEQSTELFEATVGAINTDECIDVEVRRNNTTYVIQMYPDSCQSIHCSYFLERPMTEDERLEAGLFIG